MTAHVCGASGVLEALTHSFSSLPSQSLDVQPSGRQPSDLHSDKESRGTVKEVSYEMLIASPKY